MVLMSNYLYTQQVIDPRPVLFTRSFGWLRAHCGSYPYGLDVHKLADAKNGQFATIATVLDTAKWKAWIRCRHAIAYGAKVSPSLIPPR
jgi:hypothetical protein